MGVMTDLLKTMKPNGAATCEVSDCGGCTGVPCRKTVDRYWVLDIDGYRQCKYAQEATASRGFKQSGVPAKYAGKTFADYEVTKVNERAVGWSKHLCDKKPAKGLYLYGGCGTGKTFLAALIARSFILDGMSVLFADMPTLLGEIQSTFGGKGDAQTIIDRYVNCDLLILDDLGVGKVTEWNVGILSQILNARYNLEKATVLTSNYDLRGLQERLANTDDYAAARIISRLTEMCKLVYLGTHDRRRES